MNLEVNFKEILTMITMAEDAKKYVDCGFKSSKNRKLFPHCYEYFKKYTKIRNKLNNKLNKLSKKFRRKKR